MEMNNTVEHELAISTKQAWKTFLKGVELLISSGYVFQIQIKGSQRVWIGDKESLHNVGLEITKTITI